MTEDEMVRWHHQLNGHEFEQALGNGEGQGRLACCSPWDNKELDMTEKLNNSITDALELWCWRRLLRVFSIITYHKRMPQQQKSIVLQFWKLEE